MHLDRPPFKQSLSQLYPAHSDFVTCEGIRTFPFGDQSQFALGLYHFGGGSRLGELAIHDAALRRVTAATWPGSCFAIQKLQDGEGHVDFVLFGSATVEGKTDLLAPTIRFYRYDGQTLTLERDTCWQPQHGRFTAVKSGAVVDIDGDGTPEIVTFTTTESRGTAPGFAELRIWNLDLTPRHSFRWEVEKGQTLSPWGCRAAVGDVDGDGRLEIVAVLDLRQGNDARIDVRLFDSELRLIRQSEALRRERYFSTGLCIADIDADGSVEIVLVGGTFPRVRTGATSEILLLDADLAVWKRREWRTFRHSWVWDVQLTDPGDDGRRDIVTSGGVAMDGRGQSDAHVFGELYIWDHELEPQAHHVWQQEPGLDTRPSRVAHIPSDPAAWVAVTSRWNDSQRGQDTHLLRLESCPDERPKMSQLKRFAQAWETKDVLILAHFADLDDSQWQALALEALADCGTDALPAAARILQTPIPSLFRRATHRLRHLGDEAVRALHVFGFATPDDWLIASPFDNAENGGLDRTYPSETTLSPDAVWAGRGRLVRWSRIEGHPSDVYLDLARLYYEPFERTGIELGWNSRNTEALAYLQTDIQVDSAVEAELRLGWCDGHRAWLNGTLVSEGKGSPSAIPDQKTVQVNLQRGSNRLLLKVANYRADQWGCFVRITDTSGKPLSGLHYHRPEVKSVHLEPFSQKDLLTLLDDTDETVRTFAARELARGGSAQGIVVLRQLLASEERGIQAEAALALTRLGFSDGVARLAETASDQSPYFQLEAGEALREIGDPRAAPFALENLRDSEGQRIGEWRVEETSRQFNLFPMLAGKEMGNLRVTLDRRFHFGEGTHARCASIRSFGLYSVDYRDRGLGKEAMRRLNQKLRDKGYACSTVGTGTRLVAHRLYRQQGYVDRRFAWSYTRMLQTSDRNVSRNAAVRVFSCESDFVTEVRRLRREYADHSVGPVDRITEPAVGPWIQVVCLDDQAIGFAETALDAFEPIGYLNSLYLSPEVDRPAIARAVLPLLHRHFLAEGRDRVRFSDPAPDLREVLLEQGYTLDPGCRTHRWVSMFRVVDLPRLLDEIEPLLRARLERSQHAGWRGTISLKGSSLQATLEINEEGIQVTGKSNGRASILLTAEDSFLTQLIAGNGDLWEAYRQTQIHTRPSFNERIWTLLETLFPRIPWRHWGWW